MKLTGDDMNESLKVLLQRARSVEMTPQEKERQRRSFAYGNAKIENDHVTREMIDEAAEKIARRRAGDR